MNSSDRGGAAPWDAADFVLLGAPVAVGGIACLLAWVGASGHARLEDQTGWVGLGVAGFGLAVVGQSRWLGRGRRAVAAHAARVLGDVPALVPPVSPSAAPSSSVENLVATTGMAHFHRTGCPIAAGRGWVPLSRGAHEAAGRTPCGICRP